MNHQLFNQDGTSNKFWNIATDGVRLTVRYGRVGTAGQTQEKTFASAADCEKEAEKLLREKRRKGYTELAADEAIPEKVVESPDALAPNTILRKLDYYLRMGLLPREQILEEVSVRTFEGGLDESADFDPNDFLDEKFGEDYWAQSEGFEKWLALQYEQRLALQRTREKAFPATTWFDRLAQAFASLARQGFVTAHLATDTWSGGIEVIAERETPESTGYCFYHEQSVGHVVFEPGRLWLYFGALPTLPDEQAAAQQAADVAAGQRIVAELHAQGLELEWGGGAQQAIELLVPTPWQKRFDGRDWTSEDLVVPPLPAPAPAAPGPRLKPELLAGKQVRFMRDYRSYTLGTQKEIKALLEAYGAKMTGGSKAGIDFYLGTTELENASEYGWAGHPTVFEEELRAEPLLPPSVRWPRLRQRLLDMLRRVLCHPNIHPSYISLGTPLDEAALLRCEQQLGRPLPGVLREFYQQVGEIKLLWYYELPYRRGHHRGSVRAWFDHGDNHDGVIQVLPLREMLFDKAKDLHLKPGQYVFDWYSRGNYMVLELDDTDDPLLYLHSANAVEPARARPIRFSDYVTLLLDTYGSRQRQALLSQPPGQLLAADAPTWLPGLARLLAPNPLQFDLNHRQPLTGEKDVERAHSRLNIFARDGWEAHYFELLEALLTHNGLSLLDYEANAIHLKYVGRPRYLALREQFAPGTPAPVMTPLQITPLDVWPELTFAAADCKGSFYVLDNARATWYVRRYRVQLLAHFDGQEVLLQTDDPAHDACFRPTSEWGLMSFDTRRHGERTRAVRRTAFPHKREPRSYGLSIEFLLFDIDLATALGPYGITDAATARARGLTLRLRAELDYDSAKTGPLTTRTEKAIALV